jgi:hypothetical protein
MPRPIWIGSVILLMSVKLRIAQCKTIYPVMYLEPFETLLIKTRSSEAKFNGDTGRDEESLIANIEGK